MTDTTNRLDQLMQEQLPAGGYIVPGGRALFMEVIDTATGQVWMSAAPVQRSDFEALQLEPPLARVGIASASMDSSAFHYSPGAPDDPLLERVISGRSYINVAAPMEQVAPALPGGPMEISVNKAHSVGFRAGRSITVLSLPEGDFVEIVGDQADDETLVLPQGGILKRIELECPWVVSLPNPTKAFFWLNKSMRSFQGPVTLPG